MHAPTSVKILYVVVLPNQDCVFISNGLVANIMTTVVEV